MTGPGEDRPSGSSDGQEAEDRNVEKASAAPDGGQTHVTPREANGAAPREGREALFEPGTVLEERYEVVRLLGKGGMGEVYEVRDLELGENVALKTLLEGLADDSGMADRFRREVQLARKVSHPNVCRVFEYGRIRSGGGGGRGEVLYLTMELLRGQTLAAALRESGRFSVPETLALLEQLAAGLDAAHRAGVIHRDLKSLNVFVEPVEGGRRVVITDFGLARSSLQRADKGGATLTAEGAVLGTPAYMAPEQVTGETTGPATDIYALGVVLFECLAGSRPFQGSTPMAVAVARLQGPPPPIRSLRPELPEAWEACLSKCLARRPEDRFATAADVVRAVAGRAEGELETGATAALPRVRRAERAPTAGRGPTRWTRLTRLAIFGVIGAAILSAVGIAVWKGRTTDGAASGPGSQAARRAVAILGFANLGPPDVEWLDVAVSEMLRTELGARAGVRAVPGESVARVLRDLGAGRVDQLNERQLERAADALDARVVVTGSFVVVPAPDGRSIRLDVRVRDGAAVLASLAVAGTEQKLFDLVVEAGRQIGERLGTAAPGVEGRDALRAALPADSESARLYAEGLSRLRRFDALGARDELKKAVAADPRNPNVRAALASAWSALGYDARAREEAERALALAASLPATDRLAVEAGLFETSDRWDRAAKAWEELAQRHPDEPEHSLRRAAALSASGGGAEATALLGRLKIAFPRLAADLRVSLEESRAFKQQSLFDRQLERASSAAGAAAASGQKTFLAQARLLQCDALVHLDRLDEAARAAEAARTLFEDLGDRAGSAQADNIVAIARGTEGKEDEALAAFRRALATFEEIGNRKGIASQLNNVGLVLMDRDAVGEAESAYRKALEACGEIADLGCSARTLNNLGMLQQLKLGDLASARKSYAEAATLFEKVGAQAFQATSLENLGEVLLKEKRFRESEAAYRSAFLLYDAQQLKEDATDALVGQALAVFGTGDARRAVSLLDEATELAGKELPEETRKRLEDARKRIRPAGS